MIERTVLLGSICATACAFDVCTRRLPNWLTLGTAALGLAFHGAMGGRPELLGSLAGLGVGLALFFPLFALGGMGAGDVKFMAAIGAWVGPRDAAYTALYAAICGGVLAVGVAFARGYLKTAFNNLWGLLVLWRLTGIRPIEGMTLASSKSPRLPYALPITAGLVLALWLH